MPRSATRTRPDHGHPQYQARHCTQPAFTIPSRVRIRDRSLSSPKMGWTCPGPIHRHADGQPRTVRVRQESEGKQPKGHACIVFQVPEAPRTHAGPRSPERSVLTATRGKPPTAPELYTPSPTRPSRMRRASGTSAGCSGSRRAPTAGAARPAHCASCTASAPGVGTRPYIQSAATRRDTAHTVIMEDLNTTKAITQSAQGTVEKPGRNMQRKAGLNRAIPASGRGPRECKPAYKAGQAMFADPAHTAQACSRCGCTVQSHRPSQAAFRPAGPGLPHGEERSRPGRPQGRPQGLPRPVNRIGAVSTLACKAQWECNGDR